MKNTFTESFNKHLKYVQNKLNESVESSLSSWIEQNSSGYETSFDVDAILNDLRIKKGTAEFNAVVSVMKQRGFDLVGDMFVKKSDSGDGVSKEEVSDTANEYIKRFGKGSAALKTVSKDFVELSKGGGDSDIRSGYPNWSDDNFKQLLDILYTAGGVPRPIVEKCWLGYTQKGIKTLFSEKYPNCVKKTKRKRTK